MADRWATATPLPARPATNRCPSPTSRPQTRGRLPRRSSAWIFTSRPARNSPHGDPKADLRAAQCTGHRSHAAGLRRQHGYAGGCVPDHPRGLDTSASFYGICWIPRIEWTDLVHDNMKNSGVSFMKFLRLQENLDDAAGSTPAMVTQWMARSAPSSSQANTVAY